VGGSDGMEKEAPGGSAAAQTARGAGARARALLGALTRAARGVATSKMGVVVFVVTAAAMVAAVVMVVAPSAGTRAQGQRCNGLLMLPHSGEQPHRVAR